MIKKSERMRGAKMKKIAVTALKTLLCMWITTALFIFLVSFIYYKFKISDSKIMTGILITYFISTFLGGFIFGKIMEHRKFLWGLCVALTYVIMILVIGLIAKNGNFSFGVNQIYMIATCLTGGMLGGMVS